MGFKKHGKGDGRVLDTKPTLAKLSSKIKCTACGKRFKVTAAQQFIDRLCPACVVETVEQADG